MKKLFALLTLLLALGTICAMSEMVIEDEAFAGCTELMQMVIPEGITVIGNSAFSKCTNLNDIVLPDTTTRIGAMAFYECTHLENISIPESVTSIGDSAFHGCTSLTHITIPNGVSSIEYGVFSNCASLISITIPESVTTVRAQAFFGCESLLDIAIPRKVTTISEKAFSGCSALSNVSIPKRVTSIKAGAFSDCTSLTSITIPFGVTYIADDAFSNCTSLTNIIVYAGSYAEEYCRERNLPFTVQVIETDKSMEIDRSMDAKLNLAWVNPETLTADWTLTAAWIGEDFINHYYIDDVEAGLISVTPGAITMTINAELDHCASDPSLGQITNQADYWHDHVFCMNGTLTFANHANETYTIKSEWDEFDYDARGEMKGDYNYGPAKTHLKGDDDFLHWTEITGINYENQEKMKYIFLNTSGQLVLCYAEKNIVNAKNSTIGIAYIFDKVVPSK